jgi:putative YphP/YqiW family bacilliredoxin
MYPEEMIQPMREEVTRLGVREARTAQDVEAALSRKGTALAFINSVCGCAAGNARPGLALALQHPTRPQTLITVFAGNDTEATARLRSYFKEYPPSSPYFAVLKDGKPVHILPRHEIEGRSPQDVARNLTAAFDTHCGSVASA